MQGSIRNNYGVHVNRFPLRWSFIPPGRVPRVTTSHVHIASQRRPDQEAIIRPCKLSGIFDMASAPYSSAQCGQSPRCEHARPLQSEHWRLREPRKPRRPQQKRRRCVTDSRTECLGQKVSIVDVMEPSTTPSGRVASEANVCSRARSTAATQR